MQGYYNMATATLGNFGMLEKDKSGWTECQKGVNHGLCIMVHNKNKSALCPETKYPVGSSTVSLYYGPWAETAHVIPDCARVLRYVNTNECDQACGIVHYAYRELR